MITGLDVLAAEGFQRLRGQRIGLVAHPASVDSRLRHVSELLEDASHVKLEAIFGPEHGWLGQAQDLEPIKQGAVPGIRGPRTTSLYANTAASLRPTPAQLAGLDVLLIDLQDVGARYYTFQATMLYCFEAANAVGLRVMVLDRPNPIGGQAVEGPGLRSGFESFVGAHDVPIRHGLTMGELARLYQTEKSSATQKLKSSPAGAGVETCSLTTPGCLGSSRRPTCRRRRLRWSIPANACSRERTSPRDAGRLGHSNCVEHPGWMVRLFQIDSTRKTCQA